MMEYFPSWSTMIVFDVVFLLVAVLSTAFVVHRFRSLRKAGAQFGAYLILAGVWVVALLYGFDLASMVLLPSLIGLDRSMEIMRAIHVEYSWYVNFASQLSVVVGLMIVVRRLLAQHSESTDLTEQLRREIEERKSVEKALRQSESRYAQAAEIARLGHYVWDAVAGRCVYCSDAHAEFHGLTPDEFIEKSNELSEPFSLGAEEYQSAIHDNYRLLTSGEPVEMEYCVRDGTRALRLREIAKPVFKEDGSLFRCVGTSLDITDQYVADQKSRRSQRFEIIGQLAGGVAHDFNNLLAVIIGNLELMDDACCDEENREMLASATEAAMRGSNLTQNLLRFAGKAPLEPEQVNFNELVENAQSWIGRTLPANIKLETRLEYIFNLSRSTKSGH